MMQRTVLLMSLASLVAGQDGRGGGITLIPEPRTQELDQMAWRAAKEINSGLFSSGVFHWVPVRVIKAQSQVVAGSKHYLEMIVAQSRCNKYEVPANQMTENRVENDCSLNRCSEYQKCQIEIWAQPWRNFERITVKGCVPATLGDALPILK